MRHSWNTTAGLEQAVLANLDATHGYWNDLPHGDLAVERRPALRSYDIVIVGAGLTGALLAEALSARGRSLLVIDRRMPFTGATAASSAIMHAEFDVPLHILAQRVGPGAAERLWHRATDTVEHLVALVSRLGIDCALERKQSLLLATTPAEAETLDAEAVTRNAAGLRTQFLGREGLLAKFGLDRPGALVSPSALTLNPVQLTAGLLAQASRRGAEIVANVEILDARQSGGRMHLLTSEGDFLSAGHAIFCTGCDVPDCFPDHPGNRLQLVALATRPGIVGNGWLDRHVLREMSPRGITLRTTPDGRILAHSTNGAEDPYATDGPRERALRFQSLRARITDLLGSDPGEPDHTWGGSIATAPLGLPVIARVPSQDHAHAILGYGSNGMTFGKIAADIVLAAVEGRKDPDADLFHLMSEGPASAQA